MQTFYIEEKTSRRLVFVLKDEDDINISLAALNSLQLTLYNKVDIKSDTYHLATINHRWNQNILNANNVVVSSTGTVTWSMQPNDSQILDSNKSQEHHIAIFKWRFDTSKVGLEKINLFIENVEFII